MKKFLTFLLIFFSYPVFAMDASEIDLKADIALAKLYNKIENKEILKDKTKGVLVFPSVYKAGIFFLGGEYGEGVLRVNDENVGFYNTVSGAFGFQLGAQKKSIILVFLDDSALNKFRTSENWEIGIDASVAVIDIGASGSIDTTKLNKPILAFILDQKGLMYNLTLEGTKITKINK